MLMYKLDDNDNAKLVDDMATWAQWYCDADTQPRLIVARTDIQDERGRFAFTIITRFRGQAGPRDNPSRPLVWVTEGTNGQFFGATSTKQEARDCHKRTVNTVKDYFAKINKGANNGRVNR